MRGHIRSRYEGSWNIVLDLGRLPDPKTGLLKRKRKWFTFRGTRKEAENKLTDLLHKLDRGGVIEPSKMTLGAWLTEWLEAAIKPPAKRLRTYETYKSVVDVHLKPKLGQFRLYELRASHLKQYYTESALSPASLQQHQAILHSALKAACQQDLLPRNPASLVIGKPRQQTSTDDVLRHCWERDEAR